jgi:hypothetical protein
MWLLSMVVFLGASVLLLSAGEWRGAIVWAAPLLYLAWLRWSPVDHPRA